MESSVRSTVEPTFLVVCTGRNAGAWARRLILSVKTQTYSRWRLVYIDDASDDGSDDIVGRVIEELELSDRCEVVSRAVRHHKARSIFEYLNDARISTETVLAIVDADDCLASNTALEAIAPSYVEGWDVVWSNWIGSDAQPGCSHYLNPYLPVRSQAWVSSHLFTFRSALFQSVRASDLQDDAGAWVTAACDVALAFPILESTIRRRFLDQALYLYNRDNPLSHTASGARATSLASQKQASVHRTLASRTGRVPPSDGVFHLEHLFEFQAAAHRAQVRAQQRFENRVASAVRRVQR